MKAVDLLQQQSETSANPDKRNGAHQYSNPRAVISYISTDEEDFDLDETDGAVINGKPHLTKNLRDSYSKLNGNVIKTEIKPDSNGDSTVITNGGYNEKYNDGRSVDNGVSRGKPSGDANPFREIKLPNGDVPKLSEHSAAAIEVSNSDKTSCKRPETLSFSLPERSELSPKNHVVNGTKKYEPSLVKGVKRSDEPPPLVNGSRRSEDLQPLVNGIKKAEEVLPLVNGVKRLDEVQSLVTTTKKPEVNSVIGSEELLNGAKTCEDSQPLVNGVKKLEELHPLTNGCGVSNGVSPKQDDPALVGDKQGRLINGGSAEGAESPTATWDRAVAEVKEQAFARLQEELRRAHQELRLRDEEVTRLSRIREEVEAELEELTASLFQEAHNMVREANVRQAAAERSFKESQMQVEVLTAEVSALKTLVLTSTPSRPNPHLHPQIDPRGARTKDDATVGGVSLFNRKHRRSPSHFNLKYGRENSPPESPVKEQRPTVPDPFEAKDGWEVDPNIHKEFVAWKQNPKVDKTDPFIARVYSEDINLCLDFTNQDLGAKVQGAIEEGNIFIEAVSDKTKSVFPKKCALLEAPRQCHYRMKLGDQEQWHCISQICRNRIIAVCDFLNYLRYIERGLVKSSVHDVYWEITRLRKEMVLARLGLALAS